MEIDLDTSETYELYLGLKRLYDLYEDIGGIPYGFSSYTRIDSSLNVQFYRGQQDKVWADGVDAVTSASINLIDGTITGNAQLLARTAQETTGGDLFLIQMVDAYPSDYRETTNVTADEQRENARPLPRTLPTWISRTRWC